MEGAPAAAASSTSRSTTEQDVTVAAGSPPVQLSGSIGGSDCDGRSVEVRFQVELSREGRTLGSESFSVAACGPFRHDLHPPPGPAHISVHSFAAGNLTVEVSLTSPGHSSRTQVGNEGNVDSTTWRPG